MLQHDEKLALLNTAAWCVRMAALDAADAGGDVVALARASTLAALRGAHACLAAAQAQAEVLATAPAARGTLRETADALRGLTGAMYRDLAERGAVRMSYDTAAPLLATLNAAADRLAQLATAMPAGPVQAARQPAAGTEGTA